MTVKEAADVLNVSVSFIYKLMDTRRLAYEKRGRKKLPVDGSVAEYQKQNLFLEEKPHEPPKSKRRKEPYQYEFL